MTVQMHLTPFERAGIIKAAGCPHYITARFVEATGQREQCRGCATRPVQVYGMYDQSGPLRSRKYYSHAKCTHEKTTRAREKCRAEKMANR